MLEKSVKTDELYFASFNNEQLLPILKKISLFSFLNIRLLLVCRYVIYLIFQGIKLQVHFITESRQIGNAVPPRHLLDEPGDHLVEFKNSNLQKVH